LPRLIPDHDLPTYASLCSWDYSYAPTTPGLLVKMEDITNFLSRLTSNLDLPIKISQVAKITDVSHHIQSRFIVYKKLENSSQSLKKTYLLL
jgi:hypothetical protein